MQNYFSKISLLFSLIFFVFSSLAFVFVAKEGKNNYDELGSRDLAWQEDSERREGIKKLDNSVKMISEERAKLETHFARSSNVVPFLDTLEDLAKSTGAEAEVHSVEVSQEQDALNVTMNAEGTFRSLYKFLKLLENSSYLISLTGVEFHLEQPGGKIIKSENPKWNAVFKLRLLSFIP